jgi:hypothetical protein
VASVTPAASAAIAAPKLWLGGGVTLAPVGSAVIDLVDQHTTLAASYGLSLVADYQATAHLTVGLASRYMLGIKDSASTGGDAASLFGLGVKVGYGAEVMPKLRAYGALMLGYATVRPPSSSPKATATSGPTLGAGGGVSYELGAKLRLFAEVGYELGAEDNMGVQQSFRFVNVTVGCVAAVL